MPAAQSMRGDASVAVDRQTLAGLDAVGRPSSDDRWHALPHASCGRSREIWKLVAW
jgi:hypothetical protein